MAVKLPRLLLTLLLLPTLVSAAGCQAGLPALLGSSPLDTPQAPAATLPPPTVLPPTSTPLPSATAPLPTATPAIPTPAVVGAANLSPEVNPLTGLPVENPENLNRLPVMIKVSNFPAGPGRPHAGLSYADMVFEYYIGEYMNRFLAVFYGQDTPKAWPLRSGRLIDPQLVNMYHGVLVYGSADERVDEKILTELGMRAISNLNAPCPPICGELTHSATGVYVDSASVTEFTSRHGVENTRPDLRGMLFSETPPQTSQYGASVLVQYIRWNRGEWRYDDQSGKYLRWIESWDQGDEYPLIPLVDQLTGEQLAFSNVVILFANYIEYNYRLHDVEIWDNTEMQRAVFFRDGLMVDGFWRAPLRDHPIQFFNQQGLPMQLKPGNTWIVVAGKSSEFNQSSPGQWQCMFDIP